MVGPLVNNPMGKWLVFFRRGTYQEAAENSMWPYEQVLGLWPDVEPRSDSNNDGSSDEGCKY